MNFAATLKALRLRAGLTQEGLAAAMGWSGQSRIANYEAQGGREPKLSELPRLAIALGVSVAELFEIRPSPDDLASHSGGIDPDMLAESIAALRQVAKNQGWLYDPETHAAETVYAYQLRQGLPATPSTADVIDFGAKVAERLRQTAERKDGQGEGGRAGTDDRKRAKGRK